jgi:hypothetical protein
VLLLLLPALLLLVIVQTDWIIVCACWQGTATRCCPLSPHCLAQALQQLRRRSRLHPLRRMLCPRRPLLLLHGLCKPKICCCTSGRALQLLLLLLLRVLLARRLGQRQPAAPAPTDKNPELQ